MFARRHNVSLNHASVLRSRAIEKLRARMAKVKEFNNGATFIEDQEILLVIEDNCKQLGCSLWHLSPQSRK